jgi:hypothetical protein
MMGDIHVVRLNVNGEDKGYRNYPSSVFGKKQVFVQ